ncbi:MULTISPECIES: hypothetical protein [Pseudomonas]|uniref:hypothetical protein n=1 Tax=Pseudomonas TaxID=286 RepID=UPI00057F4850|nr:MULTISPECIES: hypothetical protein [Pseudomonas]AMK37629.1 TnsA endonuclease [Pseudomonas sp. C5pp]KIC79549.1 hypothetical protein RR51_26265 [Pseudomonas sp. C5pp]QUG92793.1 hypothetical protein GR140_28985 [Pseudomonas putida]
MLNLTDFKRVLQSELEIVEPQPLASGTHIKSTTVFPSRKNNASLTCESLIQIHACLYLEQDQETAAYLPRPFVLYSEKSKIRFIPDVLAVNGEGLYSIYLLVRPDAPASPIPYRAEILESVFDTIPVRIALLDLTRFASRAKMHNLQYMYHQAYAGSPEGGATVVHLLMGRFFGQATIAALIAQGAHPADVSFALFHHLIEADLERPLTPRTVCRV